MNYVMVTDDGDVTNMDEPWGVSFYALTNDQMEAGGIRRGGR